MCKVFFILASASALVCTDAQMFIDRAGGRDILYQGGFTAANRVRTRLDTSEKSLSATYFGYALTNIFPAGNFVVGGRAKVTATDGWEEFFRFDHLPGFEGSLLANWTSADADGIIWFANGRLSYRHEEYSLFNPDQAITKQFSKPSFDGVSAAVSGGGLRKLEGVNVQLGIAASLGYERTSNYKDLPQGNVTDVTRSFPLPDGGVREISGQAQSVRIGELREMNAFPFQLIATFDIGIAPDVYSWVPFIPKDDTYGLIVAPYGEFVPKDEGKSDHAIGVQVTLRRKKEVKRTVEGVSNDKSTYPLSVFIERKNLFDDRRETRAGAAVVYNF